MFWKELDIGIFLITTWSEFEELFYLYFFLINTATKAINKLEEIIYY